MVRPSTRFLLCLVALAFPGAALAAGRAPAAAGSLPTPPGATPQLELSISDADLLPAIKQALPAVAAAVLPALFGESSEFPIEPAEVEAIFRDVQSVEVAVSTVGPPAGGAPPTQTVAQFYENELTKQGWQRLFWMQPERESIRILVMAPKAEQGLFGLIAAPSDGGKACMAIAFRLRGTINLAPIVGLAAAFWGAAASPAAPPRTETAPPPAEK